MNVITEIGIVVDLRCLQDGDYAQRGIGRHALNLLRHSPQEDHVRLIGLVDPTLPELLPDAAILFDRLVSNAYAAEQAARGRRRCFVSLSPMTHDPLWVARLLASHEWFRVAVVYDFIPYRHPADYLQSPADRLGYATRLRWLKRFDLHAPISRSTGEDLHALLGVDPAAISVVGCPVDPAFEALRHEAESQRGEHVLVIAGPDPRKNPEVAIRAHARSRLLQRGDGVPLVITGRYGAPAVDQFRAIVVAEGGRPELLVCPGHLSEEALLDLYARAFVVVSPSLDEGFSLPIIEAMAAGVPCLASDIPAQQELVVDQALRFLPDDVDGLAAAMEHLLTDSDWRDRVLVQQKEVWPKFRAPKVGLQFWRAVLSSFPTHLGSKKASTASSRPRVALLSPVPPSRSGVADYTAAICRELGKFVNLQVYSDTESPQPMDGVADLLPLTALPHINPAVDRVISVVGNMPSYRKNYEFLCRYGGVCIAHDARMLGFYAAAYGDDKVMALASQELGRVVAKSELLRWFADEASLEALFLGEFVEAATPLIVHSPVSARLVEERHGVAPAFLPFCIYRPFPAERLTRSARAAARQRLGIDEGEIAIATFGYVHDSKAPEECIWALDMLRGWGIPASLHFVGSTQHQTDGGSGLHTLAEQLGHAAHVHLPDTNYVSEQTFQDYLVGADLAIQLRTYDLGSISGALMDCASAGLPTVTNTSLANALKVPESYIRSIPNAISPVLLAEALCIMIDDGHASKRPEAERLEFMRERSAESYARLLCEAMDLEV